MSDRDEVLSGTTIHQKKLAQNSSDYNPSPQQKLPPGDADHGTQGDKIVIAMVGLPARGKTYIAHKLQRYLSFFHGAPTKVFNVGNYRRRKFGVSKPASWFSSDNEEGEQQREEVAEDALADLKDFLKAGMEKGRVAIYDATNASRVRRQALVKMFSPVLESRSHIIFVESVCEDTEIIEHNIEATWRKMPDYQELDKESAVKDFHERIEYTRKKYEPLGDEDCQYSWIKTVDGGQQVVLNKIFGYLPGRIASFVMNLHTSPKSIFLTRHGQSEYNLTQKIGGDSGLTPHGVEYAHALKDFVHTTILPEFPRARLWTSTLRRTIETGSFIKHDGIKVNETPASSCGCEDGETAGKDESVEASKVWITMRPRQWHSLDEIHAGIFDGMTYAEIEKADPEEFAMRKKDKLGYRYPRGESYLDVMQRLDTIIHELERQRDPVLIISHQGILRILYAYFMSDEVQNREDSPHVSFPLNTIKCLRPHAYGCSCESKCLLFTKIGPDGQTEPRAPDPPSH